MQYSCKVLLSNEVTAKMYGGWSDKSMVTADESHSMQQLSNTIAYNYMQKPKKIESNHKSNPIRNI